MIERCIRRMRRGDCATCDHRERCAAERWQSAFAFAGNGADAPVGPRSAPTANPLFNILSGFVTAMEQGRPARSRSLRGQVEEKLKPLLPIGHATIERIAHELGISRQTLYRRLKAEGVTFEQVLDEVRHKLALRYLGRDGIGVKQVAYLLGFSDPAAFSRAFKRWTGKSPGSMRG